ncbi:MAG: hypothetical protein LBN43_05335 [Oscillospiraceae bacterium]|jgi:hypothetical protein|nr:hypothetical protein [Oscillospiraceae bacterium]
MFRKLFPKLRNGKRAFASVLAMLLIIGAFGSILPASVNAAKLGDNPAVNKKYWPLAEDYGKALDSGDNWAIIASGNKIIELFLAGGSAADKAAQFVANGDTFEINSLYNTMYKVAPAYETIGDYSNAVRVYKDLLPFAEAYQQTLAENPDDMEFTKTLIRNKIASYDVEVAVYAEVSDGSGASYTGAKHEPKTGLYYGEPDDKPADANSQSSGSLVYVLFENETIEQRMEFAVNNEKILQNHSVIEIAWNLKNEGSSLKGVPGQSAKITSAAKYLAELKAPVLLRFGAEMNVWKNPADPADFIAAFRYVADIMHKNAPNVAMVWSVNYISAAGLTYDMFYPGDEYVDWVGVSLYTKKYNEGDRNTTDEAAAIYSTGKYANPLRFLGELVNAYGAKKPIIIAEGGVENYSVSNGEDVTDWAIPQLRATYGYAPILYPQLKAIFYFNTYRSGEPSHYDLNQSQRIKSLYNELTSSANFLKNGKTESGISYKKLGAATLPANAVTLYTYAPYFTLDNVVVTYRLNDEAGRTSSDIPYRAALDLSGYSDGDYSLYVDVTANGNVLNQKTYNLRKSGATVAISDGALPEIPEVPAAPVIVATPTASTILVNGVEVVFDAYNIGGNNYLKLRDIAYVINGTTKQFEVGFDGAANAIALTSGQPYTPDGSEMQSKGSEAKTPVPTTSKIILDGKETAFTAYNIGGNNYFKLREVGLAFDFGASWDGKNIVIDTSVGYTPE